MESVKSNFRTELRIWDKVCIVVGEGREAGLYEARIEDLINGGVVVTAPEFVSGRTRMGNGVSVAVQITRHDAAYRFHSKMRVQKNGKLRKFILTPPRRFERVQRRMFARVEFAIGVVFAALPAKVDWSNWEEQLTWLRVNGLNINGGGILLKMPKPVKPGDLALMQIDVFSEAELPGPVAACCRRAFTSGGEEYGGFEFLITDKLDQYFSRSALKAMPKSVNGFGLRAQDKLVTFLFRKQIEFRRKGLI